MPPALALINCLNEIHDKVMDNSNHYDKRPGSHLKLVVNNTASDVVHTLARAPIDNDPSRDTMDAIIKRGLDILRGISPERYTGMINGEHQEVWRDYTSNR